MNKILPLSGRGKEITYEVVGDTRYGTWGKKPIELSDSVINDILENFFAESDKWYPLGAHMVDPIPEGLGVFIHSIDKDLSYRHACAVAAIMVHEGLIDYKDKSPILLRKIKK